MRRILSAVALLLVTIAQACQRDDATAPHVAADAAAPPGRAAARLTFTTQPPAGVPANAVVSPAIQVRVTDDAGNAVPGGQVKISLGPSAGQGATLSGTTKGKIIDGVATFSDLRIDQPGRGYTFEATAGPASGASSEFAVVGPAARLAFVTEPPASVEGTAAMAPAVRVAIQDALGSMVPGATQAVTLTLGTTPSGGALAGTPTVPAVDGIATFGDLSIAQPGSGYTLAAAAPSLAGATSSPFAVHLTFTAVSAGWSHTCGVTMSGAAYCWGSNSSGELGDGSTTAHASPAPVAGGLRFAEVVTGAGNENYTCGVTTGGTAYCWGSNRYGGLGDGTTVGHTSPAPVVGGLSFASLSAGTTTCGVTTGGSAYCWGFNAFGQRGDGTNSSVTAPQAVAGGLSFAVVSQYGFATCGVTTGSAAYCWGRGDDGQLGDGTSTVLMSLPAPVTGGIAFAAVRRGWFHTCGVATDGAAYCWGWDYWGQLGDGTPRSRHNSPVPVSGGLTFVNVSGGEQHTCGVAAGGVGYCWGDNEGGQLGDGTLSERSVPTAIAGGLSFTAVSAGLRYSCGVSTSGKAYCWGAYGNGQLGNGTTTSSLTPVQVVQ